MIDYLNKETYNFYLPEELIATNPNYKRDNCKLMTMNIKTGEIEHKIFYDIIDYLKKDDILILNDSKVIPARIFAKKIRAELLKFCFCKKKILTKVIGNV